MVVVPAIILSECQTLDTQSTCKYNQSANKLLPIQYRNTCKETYPSLWVCMYHNRTKRAFKGEIKFGHNYVLMYYTCLCKKKFITKIQWEIIWFIIGWAVVILFFLYKIYRLLQIVLDVLYSKQLSISTATFFNELMLEMLPKIWSVVKRLRNSLTRLGIEFRLCQWTDPRFSVLLHNIF